MLICSEDLEPGGYFLDHFISGYVNVNVRFFIHLCHSMSVVVVMFSLYLMSDGRPALFVTVCPNAGVMARLLKYSSDK